MNKIFLPIIFLLTANNGPNKQHCLHQSSAVSSPILNVDAPNEATCASTNTSPSTLTATSFQLSKLTSEQQPTDNRDTVLQQMDQTIVEMLNAGENRDSIVTAINAIAFNNARLQQISRAATSPTASPSTLTATSFHLSKLTSEQQLPCTVPSVSPSALRSATL